jgi:2-polyprenyl-3-methyl-5-hydroxy-6-metoxy-1,4-benzoquinol methylase
VPFAELKLPGVANGYAELVEVLFKEGLAAGSLERFTLTSMGEEAVKAASVRHSLNALFYNEYYQAVQKSGAHVLFCERVYGKDLCQHGMADMDQIGTLLDVLQVKPGMALLDFGCGDGRISEEVAEQTGANVTGVDIAWQAIASAEERTRSRLDGLHFFCLDVEKNPQDFPGDSFDRIIAIDSLFFTRDLKLVLRIFFDHLKPDGQLGLFFISPPDIGPNATLLAQALKDLGSSYQLIDLSEQNRQHWILKKAVLTELEPLFHAESSDFLFKNRMAECTGNMEGFHRYLYVVQNFK